MRTWLLLYAAGAVVALWRSDASLPTRLLLALSWPVGPLLFPLTVLGLLGVAAVVSPVVGVAVALAAAAAAWWGLR